MKDEHLNVPGLFIEPGEFKRRLDYLKAKGYQVISLEEAYQNCQLGELKKDQVVITIDDGYFSVLKLAAPLLKEYQYTSTLYLTSYFFNKDCPVFTLAVGYMFWKTDQTHADFTKMNIPSLNEFSQVNLTPDAKNKIAILIKEYGQPLKGNEKRVEILKRLGEALGVDYEWLNQQRLFNLVNKEEISQLLESGIDIQLHTHRHTFPVNHDLAKKEILDNKESINPLLAKPMTHFCYPSGVWTTKHWEVLAEENIATATTCETGMVDTGSHQFAWPRILDSSRVSQIEFEAEISGFNELLRLARS